MCNELKRTIFTNNGPELLQMILELDTKTPYSVPATMLGPQGDGLRDLTSVGERNWGGL